MIDSETTENAKKTMWHCPKTGKVGFGRLPVRRDPKLGKVCAACGERTAAGKLSEKEETGE